MDRIQILRRVRSAGNAASRDRYSVLPDDTIAVVKAKLCAAATKDSQDSEDICVWSATPLGGADAKKAAADAFVTTLLRERRVVGVAEVREAFAAVSGLPPDALRSTKAYMNPKDIHAAVSACAAWTHVLQPVSMRHFDGTFPLYWPAVSPFDLRPGGRPFVADHPHDTVTYDDMTVEAFTEANTVLYFATRTDVARHFRDIMPEDIAERYLSHFFSGTDHSLRKSTLEATDRMMQEATSCDVHPSMQSSVYLKKLEVRRVDDSLLEERAVDILRVFDAVRLSAAVPYVSVYGAMHKMHSPSFATETATLQLRQWMDDHPPTLVRGTLIAHVLYGKEAKHHARLMVSDRLDLELRYDFHVSDAAWVDRATTSLDTVNSVLAQVRSAIPGLPPGRFPDLSADDLQTKLMYRMTYGIALVSHERTPTLAAISEVVRQRMRPLFLVLPGGNDRELRMQYKRRDNYSEQDHIRQYVTVNKRLLSPQELVARLMEVFSLTEERAVSAYEEGEAREASELVRYGSRTFYRTSKFWGGIHLKLVANGTVGIRVVVGGVTRPAYVDRINAALRCMMSFASGTASRAPAGRKGLRSLLEQSPADALATRETGSSVSALGYEGEDDREEREVDVELLAELQQDLASAPVPTGGPKKSQSQQDNLPPRRYILRQLYDADQRLFPMGVYPMHCGRADQRQPVKISREDKERADREFPGSYSGFVQVGSTPEKASANFFICPSAWCPKSQTPLSQQQLEALGGKCPYPDIDETPIVFDSRYFTRGVRYPGLLQAKYHPDGLQMPCCFNRPNHGNPEAAGVADEVAPHRYIQMTGWPGQHGRFALLPPALAAFLGNTTCGHRPDGTGLIGPATGRCFVRLGMPGALAQPFLHCVAHLLGAPTSVGRLVEALVRGVTMSMFLGLNDGRTLRAFVSHPKTSAGFADFKAWLPKQEDYVIRYSLRDVCTAVRKMRGLVGDDDDVWREYAYFRAYRAFQEYLQDEDIVKTPQHVLDAIHAVFPDKRFIVFDVGEEETTAVTMSCAHVRRFGGGIVRPGAPICLLARNGNVYEPIYRVKWQSAKNSGQAESAKGQVTHNALHRLTPALVTHMSAYVSECAAGGGVHPVQLARVVQQGHGWRVLRQVVDAEARLQGLLVAPKNSKATDAMLLPLPEGWGATDLGVGVLHVRAALSEVSGVSLDDARRLAQGLYDIFGEYYREQDALAGGVGLRLAQGGLVLLRGAGDNATLREALVKDRTVGRRPVSDARTQWLQDQTQRAAAYDRVFDHVRKALETSPAARDRMYYLRHPMNPLSPDQKAEVIKELLRNVVDVRTLPGGSAGMERHVFARLVVAHPQHLSTGVPSEETLASHPFVHQFTQRQVQGKTARELRRMLRDPMVDTEIDVSDIIRDLSLQSWNDADRWSGSALASMLLLRRSSKGQRPLRPAPGPIAYVKAGGKGGSPFAAAVLAAAVNARYPGLAATGPRVLAALAVDLRRQYASKGKGAAAAVPVEDAVTALMSGGEEMTPAQAVRAGELFGLDVVCIQHSSKIIEPASRERSLVLLCNGQGELIGFAADASDALLWVA